MTKEDDITLLPEYRFQWDDGRVRETTDPDFTSSDKENLLADAIEYLATLGREDEECDVDLIGMSA